MVTGILRSWRRIESLVWPSQCAGCGAWDTVLCEECEALSRAEPTLWALENDLEMPCWPLLALGNYEGRLRHLVLAAKHDRLRDLSGFLFQAGRTLGAAVAAEGAFALGRTESPLAVAWPPSSPKRQRSREEVVPVVARGVAAGLASGGMRSVALPLRRQDGRAWHLTGSLAGAGLRARSFARSGTLAAPLLPPGMAVLVVDDVCASGATLREALRAVGPAGLGAAALAVSLA